METHKFDDIKEVFCGYSNAKKIRHLATSGGIASSLVLYMFKTKLIASALSFTWNESQLSYSPTIIEDADSYRCVGSIYQEISIIHFLKKNLDNIKSPFLCFALPCQARGIRALLEARGIKTYIIQLTCSSQQTKAATNYLLQRVCVSQNVVKYIKYRGNGWPSGVQIQTKGGNEIFIPNNNSIWMNIFHSRLFIQKRCRTCNPFLPVACDIAVADPWRIDSPTTEKEGRTLCAVYSEEMLDILKRMSDDGDLTLSSIDKKLYFYSQEFTIKQKRVFAENHIFVRLYEKIIYSKIYSKYVLSYNVLFDLHCKINDILKKIFVRLFT